MTSVLSEGKVMGKNLGEKKFSLSTPSSPKTLRVFPQHQWIKKSSKYNLKTSYTRIPQH